MRMRHWLAPAFLPADRISGAVSVEEPAKPRKGEMPLAIATLFVNLCPPTVSAEFGCVCDTGGMDKGGTRLKGEWGCHDGLSQEYFYSTFRIWLSNLL